MDGVIVEIKPLKIEQGYCTDIYGSTTELYHFSVRYLTLTAMTMHQEYLKLCYMSSPDPHFFPEPDALTIHLLIAVGHTGWHYIHTVGNGVADEPSSTFNMKEARERDQFRDRLNKILVLQVTTFKEAMESKIREVLALGAAEIKRRLESRAHQDVRFSHSVREDGVWGFTVEHSSPAHEMKVSAKPGPSLTTISEDSETKLEQGDRGCENVHLPTSSYSNMRVTTSTTTKAQGRRGNKDGDVAALLSQASTLEGHAQNGGKRMPLRSRTTPDVGNARAQGNRGRGTRGGRGRGGSGGGGLATTPSQGTQRDEVEAADAYSETMTTNSATQGTRGGDVKATRGGLGGRGRGRGGLPAPV